MERPVRSSLTISAFGFFSCPSFAASHLEEIENAANTRFESELVVVKDMDIGQASLGVNEFKVGITNKAHRRKLIVLSLNANPGLLGHQSKTDMAFPIGPGETVDATSAYRFETLSPFGELFVRIFEAEKEDDVLFKARFHLGAGNPANQYDLAKFEAVFGSHLMIMRCSGGYSDRRVNRFVRALPALLP